MAKPIRLQKFIANAGYSSRRKAEEFITQGVVKVNGEVVTLLGTKVDSDNDFVEVNGSHVNADTSEKIYLLLNKPRGVMTTLNDPEGRPTVMDYCKEISERIYPVGRLDYLSEGLLLMTNDGELANRVMHPSFDVTKVYEVKVFGSVNERLLGLLRRGAKVEGSLVVPKSVRVIKQLPKKTWLEFRLGEGRNREIRRLCEEVGLTVDKLARIAIGNLAVHGIAPGRFRYLNVKEIYKALGINKNGQKVEDIEYNSPKKSVSLQKRAPKAGSVEATDESFKRYRREIYFDTMKQQKARELAEELKQKKTIKES